MRRYALPLLLASTLLAACGGGSGSSATSSNGSGDTLPPPAVTGHFFGYVSDGSHIHAVDMATAAVTEVATLLSPTRNLSRIHLPSQRGLLDGRTIQWSDLLYVDNGKLYLLPSRSETATPPAPRRLSAMSNINTSCGTTASVSADGTHEGMLFFVPDAGHNCYDGIGISYLITTDMGPDATPVTGPANWHGDMAITHTDKGISSITGFIGIRDSKLVSLDTAHLTTAVLKDGVADINYSVQFATPPDKAFVSLIMTGGQSSQLLLDTKRKTVISNLGPEFDSSTFSATRIYGLYAPPILHASSKAYVKGLDSSPARELSCTFSSASPLAVIGDLMLAYTSSAVKTLNLKTCEEKLLINNSIGNIYRFFIEDNVVYFNDPDQPLVHRLNIVSLDDATVAQAEISGSTYTLEGNAASTRNDFILLGNLDKGDGENLKLESYGLQGDRLVLGTLDSNIDAAEASFWNTHGHALNLGIISFSNADEQEHYQLYSIKPDEAGSLTKLMEKDFLQAL